MAKKTVEEKLPFGEKSKRLVELWQAEGGKDKTIKVIGEEYVAKHGGEKPPTDQTISAAKYKAFPDLIAPTRKVKEPEGPSLKNLQDLIVVLSNRKVKAIELKEALSQVQVNPFVDYDNAAGGRANLLSLLDSVATIQAQTVQVN